MLDPRITAYERYAKRDPVGHGCHLIPLEGGRWRVVGNQDSERGEWKDGEYSGDVVFSVDRSSRRHVVTAVKGELIAGEPLIVLPDWLPEIGGYFEEEIFSGFRNIVWNLPSEPDPTAYNIVHGVGHSYWVVLAVNGTTVSDFSQVADGSGGSFTFTYASWPGILAPYTATISLYVDNTLGELINQVTDS